MNKDIWINLSVAVLTAILCLCLVEFMLWFVDPLEINTFSQEGDSLKISDPILGYKLNPNAVSKITYQNYKEGHQPGDSFMNLINNKGLRDDNYTYSKDPNTTRILLMGDSFVYGWEVEKDKNIDSFMELFINDSGYEVINSGVPGYSTIQEYDYLVTEGIRFKPDAVITFVYVGNDPIDNIGVLDSKNPKNQTIKYQFMGNVRDYLSNNVYVYKISAFVLNSRILNQNREDWWNIPDYNYQKNLTIEYILKIDQVCKENDISHIVVIQNGAELVETGWRQNNFTEYEERIQKDIILDLKQNNIPYIDAVCEMKQTNPKKGDYYFIRKNGMISGHYTAKGNEEVAKIVVNHLKTFLHDG